MYIKRSYRPESLESQLLIIGSIGSPTLIDTALDTIVVNMRYTLESTDKSVWGNVRDTYTLMIQNYVFFIDAKYQCKVKSDKAEMRRMLELAGDQLSKSVHKVISLVIGSPCDGLDIMNLFDSEPEQLSFIACLVRRSNLIEEIEETKAEFIESISRVIHKLGKYSDIIGPSLIISGIVDRYKHLIVNSVDEKEYNSAKSQVDLHSPDANKSIIISSPYLTLGTLLVTSLMTGIIWIFNNANMHAALFRSHRDHAFPEVWAIVGVSLTVLVEICCFISAAKTRSKHRNIVTENTVKMQCIKQRRYALSRELDQIQRSFE